MLLVDVKETDGLEVPVDEVDGVPRVTVGRVVVAVELGLADSETLPEELLDIENVEVRHESTSIEIGSVNSLPIQQYNVNTVP